MSGPEWLAAFQSRFGVMLREPLDRATGSLRAATAKYDGQLCRETKPGGVLGSRERLAVYNLQYWFRLFGLMANHFPLVARLLGYWNFNRFVALFISARPPSGWDIETVPDGFNDFLSKNAPSSMRVAAHLPCLSRGPLLQAASIDERWRRVFLAPAVEGYRPSADRTQLLMGGRLRLSDHVALVEEHWPLLELRRRLDGDAGESAVPLPPAHAEPRYWALIRTATGIGEIGLDPSQARLFTLLAEHPLADALARLEAATPETDRADLPAKTRIWLALSVKFGFWRGLEEGATNRRDQK